MTSAASKCMTCMCGSGLQEQPALGWSCTPALASRGGFQAPHSISTCQGPSQQPLLLLQEVRNKQQAQTPRGLHAG